MCTALNIRVKGVNYFSQSRCRVGCGECEECRAAYKAAWSFRLLAELEPFIKKDWKTCFFTLTYDNAHLPTLPRSVFRNDDDYYIDRERGITRGIACFSRDDLEGFTKHMRDWFFRAGLVDIKYFIATEFGSNTQRPHAHGIYCVPPDFDCRALHSEILRYWYEDQSTRKGFVYPYNFEGGKDRHGYKHKPFVCRSGPAAVRYTAKYVTKDIYFTEYLKENGIDEKRFFTKSRDFKRCMQFHLQTRGLGKSVLDRMSDDDKLKALRDGMLLMGDTKPRSLPVFIRNKLLFDNDYLTSFQLLENSKVAEWLNIPVEMVRPEHLRAYAEHYYKKNTYIVEDRTNKLYVPFYGGITGKRLRLVRRLPTQFFLDHRKEIHAQKVALSTQFFDRLRARENWVERGVDDKYSVCQNLLSKCYHLADPYGGLANWYVTYFGQDFRRAFIPEGRDWSFYWHLRYCGERDLTIYDDSNCKMLPNLTFYNQKDFDLLNCLLNSVFESWNSVLPSRSAQNRISDRLIDYFGHSDGKEGTTYVCEKEVLPDLYKICLSRRETSTNRIISVTRRRLAKTVVSRDISRPNAYRIAAYCPTPNSTTLKTLLRPVYLFKK